MDFRYIKPIKMGTTAMPVDPSISIIHTVPSNAGDILKDIDISNTTTGTLNAYVYLVPNGGSPGTGNLLVPSIEIPANGMFQWTGSRVLEEGDTIQVKGSAAGLTIHASGGRG